ncbi:MAG: hypothetical protein AAF236_15780, partial [Verrucomicrobiota bacterium]
SKFSRPCSFQFIVRLDSTMTSPPPPSPNSHRPPSWPKTIGIICLVFGGLDLLNGLFSVATAGFVAQNLINTVELSGQPTDDVIPVAAEVKSGQFRQGLVTFGLGVILVPGAILLLKRRAVSRWILLGWSCLKLILGSYLAWHGAELARKQIEVGIMAGIAEDGNTPPEMASFFGAFGDIAQILTLVVGLIFVALLPVFLLVWFSRKKVRSEVESWS